MKITPDELRYRQALPLRDKIDLTCERIESWYSHWNGQIYIAFSGGKDSRVLLDIVRRKALIPDAEEIPAVFNDTGLEYPEIKDFVHSFPNVIVTRPKKTYRQVIEEYGYALINKEQARYLYEYRTSNSQKLKDIRLNGNRWNQGKISKKWRFLMDAPFKISHKCCDILKKNPAKTYERKSKRKPMLGSTAEESSMRKETYLRFGCNAYDTIRPISMPMAFWTAQNVLEYIVQEEVSLASVYGTVERKPDGTLHTTGIERSGCVWCLFGIQHDPLPNRFQKLKISHPKIYSYCLDKLGLREVLDYIKVPYE